ncbi:phage baseplate assembly protein V, partial [Hafnia paralvei]
ATGEISDGKGKMSGIRLTYNGHTHKETDSVTKEPNQKM